MMIQFWIMIGVIIILINVFMHLMPFLEANAWLIVPVITGIFTGGLALCIGSEEVTLEDANYLWGIIGGAIGLAFGLYVMSHS